MTMFVLVHGAWHGAWCWEPLLRELEARGHEGIAVDLPIADVEATFDDYVDTVVAALAEHPLRSAQTWFVGHSMGAVPVARVACRLPVAGVVYVAGVVPAAVESAAAPMPQFMPGALEAVERDGAGREFWPDAGSAIAALYQDTPADLAGWAASRLRHQSYRIWRDNPPLPAQPAVPTVSVVSADDRVVNPEWSRWIARNWLGVEPIELAGDHSPMLSRPADLATVLEQVVG